ncbi:hypothetical protein RvY_01479 [Ramazzottius varieornatus]|uniref:Protein sleepless n=1 Tax=Ramazzottius varieornatus TaxID=947166 RepID=A0A1D1UK01_RAMVA|nr:hypothetical protein RvY_01479 [Ramazzottius varieornatus]
MCLVDRAFGITRHRLPTNCCILVVHVFALIYSARNVHSISCYECNSHYDPRCDDHFDNLTYPLTDCKYKVKPHLGLSGAPMCRKAISYVQGEKRVVRECAFFGLIGYNDGRWCLERMGTKYIKYSVCLCNNKDGCNGASLRKNLGQSVWLILVLRVLVVLAAFPVAHRNV